MFIHQSSHSLKLHMKVNHRNIFMQDKLMKKEELPTTLLCSMCKKFHATKKDEVIEHIKNQHRSQEERSKLLGINLLNYFSKIKTNPTFRCLKKMLPIEFCTRNSMLPRKMKLLNISRINIGPRKKYPNFQELTS